LVSSFSKTLFSRSFLCVHLFVWFVPTFLADFGIPAIAKKVGSFSVHALRDIAVHVINEMIKGSL
jgi:hypothetical protein